MSEQFWLNDKQWRKLKPLLPADKRGRRVDDRRVISGIVHVLKSGGRWADAPHEYGPKKTLYNRFVRWAERGIWKDIFQTLAAEADMPERLFMDSTFIKAHRCSGGAKGGPRVMLLASAGAAATRKSTR